MECVLYWWEIKLYGHFLRKKIKVNYIRIEYENAQEARYFLSIFSNHHFSRNFRTSSSGSPENLLISSGENLESCSMRCAVNKACSWRPWMRPWDRPSERASSHISWTAWHILTLPSVSVKRKLIPVMESMTRAALSSSYRKLGLCDVSSWSFRLSLEYLMKSMTSLRLLSSLSSSSSFISAGEKRLIR